MPSTTPPPPFTRLIPDHLSHQVTFTPAEVGTIFGVDPKTVTRWARDGRIGCFATPGGHRRYRREEIIRILLDGYRAATGGPAAADGPGRRDGGLGQASSPGGAGPR
jgi:hypothetical protein